MSARPVAVESEPAARRARRGPLTRTQILDAALRLFSVKGFARTSVRDIAQAAGITDAAIYYHFDSKRELFEALIEERGFTAAIEGLERAEVTVGPEEAIPGIAQRALELMYANRDLMTVLLVEALAGDAVAADEYRMLAERWEKAQARILRVYAKQGAIRITDIDELAHQLAITVIGVFADYMVSSSDQPADGSVPPALSAHVRAAMCHIIRGITAKG